MSIKGLREGHLIGSFNKKGEYVSLFIDLEGSTSSYGDSSYVDASQCTNPLLTLNMIREHYSSAVKRIHEEDTYEYEHSIEFPFFPMNENSVLFLNSIDLGKFFFQAENWPGTNLYKVKISTELPLYYLLHFVQAVLFLSVVTGEEYVNTKADGLLEKYMKSISISGLPYKLLNSIKVNCLTGNNFSEYVECLEKSYSVLTGNSIHMVRGNTLQVRKQWVESQISEQMSIVDVGCNSGNYLYLSRRVPYYYPIDIDENSRNKTNLKAADKHMENVSPAYDSLESWFSALDSSKRYQYLLTEVLEHMSVEQAKKVLIDIFSKGNADAAYITFPNYEFNYFYAGEISKEGNEFRHKDHVWEGTPDIVRDLYSVVDTIGNVRWLQESIGDAIIVEPSATVYKPTYTLTLKRNMM
jgi:hypothetical protein